MVTFMSSLYQEMCEQLEHIETEQENMLDRARQSYTIVEEALRSLKEFMLSYSFQDKQEEIRFFKEEKPRFLKEFIYYAELFYIESNRPVGRRKTQKAHLELGLERTRIFFERNNYLYSYYRTGQTYLDETFFLSSGQEIPLLPAYTLDIDSRFSTIYSYKIAKLQAFEQLRDYLQTAIISLDNPMFAPSAGQHKKKKWRGSKAELIELGYALQSRGVFGSADVKQVINYLEDCFDTKVGNFYRVFQGQRIRKKSRTSFLDSLKESLIRRMDYSDLNPKGL